MGDSIAVSPCSNPEMELDEVLRAYSGVGFSRFEVFTGWVKSAFDFTGDPAFYLAKGKEYGMRFVSLHLPVVSDTGDSLEQSIRAARFAEAIGAGVALFKAKSRELYGEAAGAFLDSVEDLAITPVLQNHAGSPISTLEDYREVIERIDDDRMKAVLEVGHFHTVGVSWREGYELLGDRVAIVHVKDQIGSCSVPFGQGEIDLPGLFRKLESDDYGGHYVLEMEVKDRERTLEYLQKALHYVEDIFEEMGECSE